MFSTIMNALNWALAQGKDFLFGDLSWDALFFFNIATWGLLLYLAHRFTKVYNPEELKKKWLGGGYLLHGVHVARNRCLRTGAYVALIFLYMSGVTAGSSRTGTIADCASPMTTLPTGFYQVSAQFGQEKGLGGEMKQLVYIRPVDLNGRVAEQGKVFKVGQGEIAMNTNIDGGQYIDVALSHGGTWISNVSGDQMQAKLEKERNSAKGFFANLFSPISNFFSNKT